MNSIIWRAIAEAPHDGTEIVVRTKNGLEIWQRPVKARFVRNTAIENPWITHFWSCQNDDNGHPIMFYGKPEEWTAASNFAAALRWHQDYLAAVRERRCDPDEILRASMTLTEKFGIKYLAVGSRVKDPDYGWGRVIAITPTSRQPWHHEDFDPGDVQVLFDDGDERVVPACLLLIDGEDC